MSAQWWALFRPGRPDPEAADYDKSDLISTALRRTGARAGKGLQDRGLVEAPFGVGLMTRDAAWKRLRRRGWRIELLPEQFWEAVDTSFYYREGYASGLRRGDNAKSLDLLRELAEDRHEFGAGDPDHTGTLRTCRDRLCDAAATLLGRRGA